MKKSIKNNLVSILILVVIALTTFFLATKFKFIYGSKLDWSSQHFALPEYFRNLFYSTGNLFPNFSLNIGGGQNIYNFAYYGLFSPIILLSYLFPFIKMSYYIMGTSLLSVIISAIMIYFFVKRKYNQKISLIAAIIFICATPLLFHSHRHIMFITYLPFLIMGFYGVDNYFKNNKKALLIISVFLLILTNYFFSVSGICVLIIYGIYIYIKTNKKITVKRFIIDGLKFIFPIFIGILMAMFLISPVFYTLIMGRSKTSVSIDLKDLLIPSINASYYLYNTYGMGLTSFLLFSMIENLFSKKRENIFLSIISILIMVFPIFVYILNGTMYINSKVLIAFLPLYIISIANTINNLFKNVDKKELLTICILYLGCSILVYFFDIKEIYFVIDVLIISISFIFYYIFKKKIIFIIGILIVSVSCPLAISFVNGDNLVTIEDFNKYNNKNIEKEINEVINNNYNYRINNNLYEINNINRIFAPNYLTTTVYSSVENNVYKNFYFYESGNEISYRNNAITASNNNILFNTYMGNKYLVADSLKTIGYNKINNYNNTYINENVFPIGYATNSILSKDIYDKLTFPYKNEALLNYAIVNTNLNNTYKTNVEKVNNKDIVFVNQTNLNINQSKNSINIESTKNNSLHYTINNTKENDIILIDFDMNYSEKCSVGDTYIIINGIKNVLTCRSWKYHNQNYHFTYVLSNSKKIEALDIKFAKGKYKISNIKINKLNYNYVIKSANSTDKFNINYIKGDYIKGSINVTNNGYFILNIPYDKGFNIYVDGVKKSYELVNESFMGLSINKGNHNIEISYEAPLSRLGKYISLLGIIIFAIILLAEKRGKKYEKNIHNSALL